MGELNSKTSVPNLHRPWLWGVGLVVLVLILAFILWPRGVSVDLARAERGPLRVTLREDGQTRVRDRYVISAPVQGTMLRNPLEAGDRVQEHDVVARLQPSRPQPLDERTRAEASGRLQSAKAALEQARAERGRAEVLQERAQRLAARQAALLERGATSAQAAEQAILDAQAQRQHLQVAESSVRAAQGEVAAAEAVLGEFDGKHAEQAMNAAAALDVSTPVAGTILRVLKKSESVVAPGEPLLEIGDPENLEVVVDVLSTDAVRVERGALAVIDRFGGDETIRGSVERVEPAAFTEVSALGIDEQRVTIVIHLDESPAQIYGLGDGFRVEAEMLLWERPDVLSVPATAIFRHHESWAAYRLENGRARLQRLNIGESSGERVQILNGLNTGDELVASPDDRIHDGVRIRSAR